MVIYVMIERTYGNLFVIYKKRLRFLIKNVYLYYKYLKNRWDLYNFLMDPRYNNNYI